MSEPTSERRKRRDKLARWLNKKRYIWDAGFKGRAATATEIRIARMLALEAMAEGVFQHSRPIGYATLEIVTGIRRIRSAERPKLDRSNLDKQSF